MTLRFRSASAAAAALVLGMSLMVAGCGKYSMAALKAQKAYKAAVDFYKAQDWKQAVANYEYTVQQNPDKVEAYFYLGNSYDNLYKPSPPGGAGKRRLHAEGHRELPESGAARPEPADEEAGARVPRGGLRS